MKKNDKGLEELLKLLQTHPELIKELVFDSTNIRRLLKTKAARKLALGVDTTAFLLYVAGPEDGYPVSQCLGGTKALCAKGTGVGVGLNCRKGTRRPSP
ncbi:MAG: hypothetical protein JO341_14905 [Gammaproteobacteria bacterium]|nr:hypothetical protein [Gammaproteobacteria bacterium]MBV9622296.1 hypothetical protein [Gammaproteobacteria bacterium]